MITEVYADTVGRVDFAAGVVRFELVSLEPREGTQGKMEVRQRIVMPVEGFLSALNTMGDLVNKLVGAGVLRRGEQPAAVTAAAAEPAKT